MKSFSKCIGASTAVSILLAATLILPMQAAPAAQAILYQEDFESGDALDWNLEPGWQVTADGENQVLAGQGHAWAKLNRTFIGDQRISFRLKLLQGGVHLVSMLTGTGRYFIGFDESGSFLNKQYFPDEFHSDLAGREEAFQPGRWYQVEILFQGGDITFYVDGTQKWTWSDPQPFTDGGIAFETLGNGQVWVDDIIITDENTQAVTATQAPAAGIPTGQAQSTSSATAGTDIAELAWLRTGGPLGGLGYDIRMQPDNPDIMYVTDANAGVHKSTDGGHTWVPMNNGIDLRTGQTTDLIPVFCLTIDPNNYETIWIGLQGLGGIYRSRDGGATWEKRMTGLRREGFTVRGISIEPGNSEVVYAAGEIDSYRWAGEQRLGHNFDMTRGFVYKSTDGGGHWQVIWEGDNLARYIWIDPTDTDTLYVSTGIFDREASNTVVAENIPGGVGILKSTDGGETWKVLAEEAGLTGLFLGSLFMQPGNPDVLLAGAGHDYWSLAYDQGGREISPAGVFLTENGGETWTQTLAHEQIYSVEYCLGDPDIAYAAGPFSIHRSQDGGHTWQLMSGKKDVGGYWGPPGVVAGFPIDVQCDPRDPDRLFVNNYGGGNLVSEDGGQTWADASRGYSGAMVLGGLALDVENPARILAGARSGLFLSQDGGMSWSGLAYSPARHTEITSLAFDPSNPETILSSPWDLAKLVYSSNDGTSWRVVEQSPGLDRESIRPVKIVFAPSDPTVVYAGVGRPACRQGQLEYCSLPGEGIYVSRNGGKNWESANDKNTSTLNVVGLAVHPQEAEIVFAAALDDGLFMTSDGGKTWQLASLNRQAWSVSFNPSNSGNVLAGTRGGIYQSQDGGTTWQQTASGMPAEALVRAVVVDPANPQNVWAADYFSGVYHSSNGGQTWQQHNDGLTVRCVVDLALSNDGLTLYAATHGGGVYRLSAYDQATFDALAPTPMPTQAASPTVSTGQAGNATTTKTTGEESSLLGKICPGSALLPLALIGLVFWLPGKWRRKE